MPCGHCPVVEQLEIEVIGEAMVTEASEASASEKSWRGAPASLTSRRSSRRSSHGRVTRSICCRISPAGGAWCVMSKSINLTSVEDHANGR
jgi:hypothetical protein